MIVMLLNIQLIDIDPLETLIESGTDLKKCFEKILSLNEEDIEYDEADYLNTRLFYFSDRVKEYIDSHGESDDLEDLIRSLVLLNNELYEVVCDKKVYI